MSVSRSSLLALDEEKKTIESELAELYSVLQSHNVTMDEPLVDKDGYPRNDIDVYQVRRDLDGSTVQDSYRESCLDWPLIYWPP